MAAKRSKAKDWWFGTEIALGGKGGFSIEYHHIHPRATLMKDYVKAEINDLANYAFISAKANKKISDRSPAKYFPELLAADPDALRSHFVPEDERLRSTDRFRDFLSTRRQLLASAMTDVLDGWRPATTGEAAPAATDPTSGGTLAISVVSTTYDPLDGIVIFDVMKDEVAWSAAVPALEFDRFLSDLSEGLVSDIVISGERVAAEPDSEVIEVPLGPLLATGSLEDWQKIWDREYEEASSVDSLPTVPEPEPWPGERIPFGILGSE
jgi:hypothetical protein